MTLHEAIASVLSQKGTALSAARIAALINRDNLYSRNDGKPVPTSQINARVNNYLHIFKKNNEGLIELLDIKQFKLEDTLWNMLNNYRNSLAHGVSDALDYLLIPLCFFYKRVADNPYLLPTSDPVSLNTTFSTKSFIGFLKYLSSYNKDLSKPLLKLVDELTIDPKVHIDELISQLKDIDLSEINFSVSDFSKIYLNIIKTVLQQDFKRGLSVTPQNLASLISRLALFESVDSVINPGTGIGTLPVYIFRSSAKKISLFYGQEIDNEAYLLAYTNLIINHIETINFKLADALDFTLSTQADYGQVFVCNPPFESTIRHNNKNGNTHKSRTHILFLKSILNNLGKKGRAIILLPDGFMFSTKKDEIELREEIVNNRILEGIISLPAGILYPHSGIKTSLLILNSNQGSKESYIIDTEHPSLHSEVNKGKIELKIDSIIELITRSTANNNNQSDTVQEPIETYRSKVFTSMNIDNPQSFIAKRLISEETNINYNDQDYSNLGEVVEFYTGKRVSGYKFVNISDLNYSYTDFNLNTNKLSKRDNMGLLLNEPAFLIGSISGSTKPSYFDGNEEISVSPNVYILKVLPAFSGLVVPEYLVLQFGSEDFQNQITAYSAGTTSLKRISKTDLLNIRIRIPKVKEQLRIIRNKKEEIVQKKLNEISELESIFGIRSERQLDYLNFIEHEYNNIAGGISNNLKSIRSFLNKNNIDLNQKISGRKGSNTVTEVFDQTLNNFSSITNLIKGIKDITELKAEELALEETNFTSFIKDQIALSSFPDESYTTIVNIENETLHAELGIITINPRLFSIVIRNFISNSVKHGYSGTEINKHLIFQLTEDDDFSYINLINDGRAFPEGFDFDDFISFGSRAGDIKGSGIGGHLMNEIIKLHSGELHHLTENELLHVNKGSAKLIIKVGIHLQIKLPKMVL